MKKYMKMIGFAAFSALFVVGGAMAAKNGSKLITNEDGICLLIAEFQGIFKLMRTLAFVGAGFIIASWAWGYISGGKEIKATDEVKNKGISMLIGFILLFGIGVVLNVLSTATGAEAVLGCTTEIFKGW